MNCASQIYLVIPKGHHSTASIYGCFDTEDNVEAFINRFKTVADYDVIELDLNPNYNSNKSMDPYFISIGKTDPEPLVFYIASSIDEADDAYAEKFEVVFCNGQNIDEGVFNMHLFAMDKRVAVERVKIVRDAVIAQGEWQAAWEKQRGKVVNALEH
ncbi:MAG: hypothetical protein P0Y49_16535 [Candidatus Pedobacter colombiensis]|uniref:Uncharacterized protein n=1 Tax=Candidatus Pedobacter colombiensis TaxID=3121371 RepID=A0AAJ5W4L2_9SPHI|nr:hypothetical protein [Pedobacter sp.]WEK18398.1 MAG: hypothetical protein P0Y49_16535 [Pedobacter sp.]